MMLFRMRPNPHAAYRRETNFDHFCFSISVEDSRQNNIKIAMCEFKDGNCPFHEKVDVHLVYLVLLS